MLVSVTGMSGDVWNVADIQTTHLTRCVPEPSQNTTASAPQGRPYYIRYGVPRTRRNIAISQTRTKLKHPRINSCHMDGQTIPGLMALHSTCNTGGAGTSQHTATRCVPAPSQNTIASIPQRRLHHNRYGVLGTRRTIAISKTNKPNFGLRKHGMVQPNLPNCMAWCSQTLHPICQAA
jgi:hypothetical protein